MTEEQHEILIRIDERTDQLIKGQDDQEKRIRALERFRNWAGGLVAVGASALGIKITPIG